MMDLRTVHSDHTVRQLTIGFHDRLFLKESGRCEAYFCWVNFGHPCRELGIFEYIYIYIIYI